MKRIISCLLLAAVTLLSGCSVVKPKLDPNAFYVEVDVKSEGVYILECKYSLDGESVGGRSVQNADFAKLECAVQRRVQIRARKIAGRLFYISDKLR